MKAQDYKLARQLIETHSVPVTETGCWLWDSRGRYGRVTFKGVKTYAHRLAFEAFKGGIPPGVQVVHACGVPGCVNPAHLRLRQALPQPRHDVTPPRPQVAEESRDLESSAF